MNKLTLTLLGTFVGILLLSAALAYVFRERPPTATAETSQTSSPASPSSGDPGSKNTTPIDLAQLEQKIQNKELSQIVVKGSETVAVEKNTGKNFVVQISNEQTKAEILKEARQLDSTGSPKVANVREEGTSSEKQKGQSSDQSKQNGGHNVISELFGLESPSIAPSTFANWETVAARVAVRFSLAAFLAALLAFRPRKGMPISRRNPYVAETQILMAVVAGAMMMVVGDSAARAFGIFAAASLVRFRTNIRDPKEITVLLVCLGVGLAAGVGRWDMAIVLSVFVLLTLAILEYFEESQVFRSMQVSVSTRNTDTTHEVLKRIFTTNRFDIELRELNRPDEDKPMGKIVYVVNIRADVSTDRLSDEILASDSDNIDTVEWEQKVSDTYMYK